MPFSYNDLEKNSIAGDSVPDIKAPFNSSDVAIAPTEQKGHDMRVPIVYVFKLGGPLVPCPPNLIVDKLLLENARVIF